MQTKETKHVFFIVSPITLILSWLIIKYKKLDDDEFILYFLRGYKSGLLPNSFQLRNSILKRILQKLNFNPNTNEVLKGIGNKCKFFIYVSWCFDESAFTPDIKLLLSNRNCLGHSYIEEGQLSYVEDFEYHDSFLKKSFHDWFRKDALKFYAISDKAFPKVRFEKKIILDNLSEIKKVYSAKLLGIKNIGITCAERRVSRDGYQIMLNTLINHLCDYSVIKLHPSFESNDYIFNSMIDYVRLNNLGKNLTICDKEVIIELEMLFEEKNLIGSISSLKIYAELFNSSYEEVKLY